MRGILVFILSLFVISAYSQGINFQGVARSANGTILANSSISLRLSILSKSVDVTPEFVEVKKVVTNSQGIFSIVVGDGVTFATMGIFKNLNWAEAPKFLKVEMDPSGGSNYLNMGITQLQYVPFSFYSLGVDAANVAGVLPVKSGGTGVASISDLKVALVLDKVNNTADLDKPISTLTQTALDTKLNKVDTISLSNRINSLSNSNTSSTLVAPNMTISKRNLIVNPSPGLIIFCTDCSTPGVLQFYNGSNWVSIFANTTNSFSLPEIETTTVSDIRASYAYGGGNVISDGGATILARGICYGVNQSPTTSNSNITFNETNNNKIFGQFAAGLYNLLPAKKYYVRSFATNNAGTAYGAEKSFTTYAYPSLSTKSITGIRATTSSYPNSMQMSSGGIVSSNGGIDVVKVGIIYDTASIDTSSFGRYETPFGNNYYGYKYTTSSLTNFSIDVTGLLPNTKYYTRAIAFNKFNEIGYGQELNFTTTSVPNISNTKDATSITNMSAISGGEVLSDNGAPITSRGVVWSRTGTPVVTTDWPPKIAISAGTVGDFSVTLSGLNASTLYTIRSFATNINGTTYGASKTFTTLAPTLPTINDITIDSTGSYGVYGKVSFGADGGANSQGGVCYSTSPNPTIADRTSMTSLMTSDSGPVSRSGATIPFNATNLGRDSVYYIRGFQKNSVGTVYTEQKSFTYTAPLSVGQLYQGGIIAYILNPGDPGFDIATPHGLIVAITSTSSIPWNNGTWNATGASGIAIGTGLLNTNNIIISQGNSGSYAAKICRAYTGGGYTDWYLPSKDELNKIYLNRLIIGGIESAYFWSSTELNGSLLSAFAQPMFSNGSGSFFAKDALYYVRAIRSF
jgi:hypothetical protein